MRLRGSPAFLNAKECNRRSLIPTIWLAGIMFAEPCKEKAQDRSKSEGTGFFAELLMRRQK